MPTTLQVEEQHCWRTRSQSPQPEELCSCRARLQSAVNAVAPRTPLGCPEGRGGGKGKNRTPFFFLLWSYEDSHILILLSPGTVKPFSRARKDKVSEVLSRTESLPFYLPADLLKITYLP